MTEEEREAALLAEKEAIGRHVQRYVELRHGPEHPDDPPYVVGWVVGTEWTNMELERTHRGGVTPIAAEGQAVTMSRGLAEFVGDYYVAGG